MGAVVANLRRSHKMRLGAEPLRRNVCFKIKGRPLLIELEAVGDGWHRLEVGVRAGSLYKYVLPDDTEILDPSSRHQPNDVFS